MGSDDPVSHCQLRLGPALAFLDLESNGGAVKLGLRRTLLQNPAIW